MWTLLMDGTFMDSTGTVLGDLKTLTEQGSAGAGLAVLVFLIFILLSAMTVLNMLIGVLCEVVSAVGASEKDEAAIRAVKSSIWLQLKDIDVDGNDKISQ